MKINLNRRDFLAALAGLGATIVLPVPAYAASGAQVDEAWDALLQDPWYFEVDAHGTILEAGDEGPSINGDVYDINVTSLMTPADVVSEVEQYEELITHFQTLAAGDREDIESELEQDALPGARRRVLQMLSDALVDEDDGWRDWVLMLGREEVGRFRDEISGWLEEPVNSFNSEFWPQGWSGQGRALMFFRDMDFKVTKGLGVKVVEGEHPGSSYYAAELRSDVATANAACVSLELPFRFRMTSG